VDFEFCPTLEELVSSRRTVGKSGRVYDNLAALTTVNSLHALRALLLDLKPVNTLEVGLSFGGSALTIAASHRDLGHTAARQHVAIDPFQRTVWDSTGLLGLERAGLHDYVEFREQPSAIALGDLAGHGRTFDFIYVDGSHRLDDVFVDAYFALRLLAPQGVVVFDDAPTDAVSSVLRFIEINFSTWATEMDLTPFRSKNSSMVKYAIAKTLGRVQQRAFRRIGDEPSWDADVRLP
jgi:hypothetical protein